MGYITNKEKVKDYIEKNILEFIKKKEINYYKTIDLIKLRTNASQNMVEEILKSFINSGSIREIRYLTIPEDQIVPWLKELKEMEEETRKILESKQEATKNATKK